MRKTKSICVVVCVILGALAMMASSQERAAAQVTGLRSVPLGYQQITSLSASTALTVPTGSTTAVITPEAQAVRYRDDGTAPSATVGQPLAVAATLVYTGNLTAIRFIEQVSGAKLNVSYYR